MNRSESMCDSDDLSKISAGPSELAGEWPSPSGSEAREPSLSGGRRADKHDADGWPIGSDDEEAPKKTPKKKQKKEAIQESARKVAKNALPGSAKGLAEHIKATSTRQKIQSMYRNN